MILGNIKRISNNDIVNFLMQPAPKQQLSTMSIENIFPYVGFTEENLREYYENPPAGIDFIFNLLFTWNHIFISLILFKLHMFHYA